jgi:membrane peptidoglycan carboxypeptidase
MFGTLDAAELPTIQDLGAILAKVANKDEVSPEAIDLIHQRMIEAGVITNEELEAASASLAPSSAPSLDATAPAPTFAELLTEQANLVQASQATQGLGSIY